MGVTIHYNGKLRDRARLAELLDAARLYCAEQRWAYLDVDERILGRVERVLETNTTTKYVKDTEFVLVSQDNVETEYTPIDDVMQGIIITPHPKSEQLALTFNQQGELVRYMPLDDLGTYWEIKSLFTKTQFAGMETHSAVCEFLHFLQDNYMPDLHVYDEANYFESGDANRATDALDTTDTALDGLQGALEGMDDDDPRTAYIREVMDSLDSDEKPHETPRPKPLKVERAKKIAPRKPQWKRGHGSSAGKN